MKMENIAEKAGVSVSTVSKAFSGRKDIGKKKREEIFQIARELGCYDKYCKDKYSRPVIAVIVPEFGSRLYAEQLTYYEKEIRNHGGVMVVASTGFDDEHKSEMVDFFATYSKVDGIIIYENLNDKQYSIPIVAIVTGALSEGENSIFLSNGNAVEEAIAYLVENGHSDIAFISEKFTSRKKKTFQEAMERLGLNIPDEYIVESSERFEMAGYNAMNQLLELEKIPTAVLTAYDNIAIGAMKSITEHGLKIPDDISIIGIDNIREGSYLDVPLTTVTAYNEELCQIVTDILFEQINDAGVGKTKKIKVNKELIKRGSVGRVKR